MAPTLPPPPPLLTLLPLCPPYSQVAAFLALGANFLGVTSNILGLVPPSAVGDLDVVYPVKGFKRFRDQEDGYTFQYPEVGDDMEEEEE